MITLMVVETEDDIFVGTVEYDWQAQTVTIKTGYRGRPKVLTLEDIVEVTPAWLHPDVEFVGAPS